MSAENNAFSAAEAFAWWQGNPDISNEEARLLDAAAIRAAADEVIEMRVIQARDEGLSWAKIGEALGISKQAAAKRWGKAGQLPL